MNKRELRLEKINKLKKEYHNLNVGDLQEQIKVNKQIAALLNKTELIKEVRTTVKSIIEDIKKGSKFFDNATLAYSYSRELHPFIDELRKRRIFINNSIDNIKDNLFMTYYYVNRNSSDWNKEEYYDMRSRKWLKLLVNTEEY